MSQYVECPCEMCDCTGEAQFIDDDEVGIWCKDCESGMHEDSEWMWEDTFDDEEE